MYYVCILHRKRCKAVPHAWVSIPEWQKRSLRLQSCACGSAGLRLSCSTSASPASESTQTFAMSSLAAFQGCLLCAQESPTDVLGILMNSQKVNVKQRTPARRDARSPCPQPPDRHLPQAQRHGGGWTGCCGGWTGCCGGWTGPMTSRGCAPGRHASGWSAPPWGCFPVDC